MNEFTRAVVVGGSLPMSGIVVWRWGLTFHVVGVGSGVTGGPETGLGRTPRLR